MFNPEHGLPVRKALLKSVQASTRSFTNIFTNVQYINNILYSYINLLFN